MLRLNSDSCILLKQMSTLLYSWKKTVIDFLCNAFLNLTRGYLALTNVRRPNVYRRWIIIKETSFGNVFLSQEVAFRICYEYLQKKIRQLGKICPDVILQKQMTFFECNKRFVFPFRTLAIKKKRLHVLKTQNLYFMQYISKLMLILGQSVLSTPRFGACLSSNSPS